MCGGGTSFGRANLLPYPIALPHNSNLTTQAHVDVCASISACYREPGTAVLTAPSACEWQRQVAAAPGRHVFASAAGGRRKGPGPGGSPAAPGGSGRKHSTGQRSGDGQQRREWQRQPGAHCPGLRGRHGRLRSGAPAAAAPASGIGDPLGDPLAQTRPAITALAHTQT